MHWQKKIERRTLSADRNDTLRFELPEKGLYSGLLIKVSCDQESANSGQENYRLIDQINKVEVMANGSKIIKSLSGIQLQALSFYDHGIAQIDTLREYASNTQFAFIPIQFGRRLYDRDYLLDMAKYDVVELKLTNNMSSTYWQDTLSYTIIGYVLKDVPADYANKGYFKSHEWRKYTTVADEWKYLDIPAEHPLRRIMLRAEPDITSGADDTAFENLVYDIKFMLQTGDVIVFEGKLEDLLRDNLIDYGALALTGGHSYRVGTDYIETGIGRRLVEAAIAFSMTGSASTTVPTTDDGHSNHMKLMPQGGGDIGINWMALGCGFHNTAMLRFDREPDLADMIDTVDKKQVELHLHTRNAASAADGTVSVVLEELMTD